MPAEIQRLRRLSILLGCISLGLAGTVAWLVLPQFLPDQSPKVRYDEDIIFPVKTFGSSDAWVAAKGTLVADWIGYKNNTFSILCLRDECIVASVEQIGPKQVGSIDGPTTYPVIRWTNDEVVAQGYALCSQITISFQRKSQTVLWVETPINQTEIACKNADNTIRKATLETSLYWQRSKYR